MRNNRGHWYLLTGVLLGLVLGLVYAWVISPVRFVDNPPSSMREDFKNQYRALIAVAYTASQDLGRAQARLALLGDADAYSTLAAQAQQMIAQGGHPGEARALGELASVYRRETPDLSLVESTADTPAETALEAPVAGTPTGIAATTGLTVTESRTGTPSLTPEPRATVTPSRTPLPTRTPTPTEGLPFVLLEQTLVCDPDLQGPLIQIYAQDVDALPIPGVQIFLSWPEGEETFFTGLKPELGPGYADYLMMPGVLYSVRLQDGGAQILDLGAEECESPSGVRYWGSWSLIFAQP